MRDGPGQCFFVIYLWCAHIALYFEFTAETIDDNFQVKLTHTTDNRLVGILIILDTEGWIFLCQFVERHTQLLKIFLRLRLYSDTNYRFGEDHTLENDRIVHITECISCTNILEAYGGSDITRLYALNRILLICVHLIEPRDAFFRIRTRIVDIATCIQRTRIDAHESETTHERICSNFECQCCERVRNRRSANLFFLSLRIDALNCFYICRRGQESAHSIQDSLNPLILERRATHHRDELHIRYSPAHCSTDLVSIDGIRIFEILFHQCFVIFSHFFEQTATPLTNSVYKIGRDRNDFISHALIMFIPNNCLIGNKIDDSFKLFL